jgi:hypothetical protein
MDIAVCALPISPIQKLQTNIKMMTMIPPSLTG